MSSCTRDLIPQAIHFLIQLQRINSPWVSIKEQAGGIQAATPPHLPNPLESGQPLSDYCYFIASSAIEFNVTITFILEFSTANPCRILRGNW